MSDFPKNVKENLIELKGEMFSTEEDRKLAKVIMHKLLEINLNHRDLFRSKIEQTFGADPFSFVSSGLGHKTSCRNWCFTLKSKKRFLLDMLLEDQFKEIIGNLPKDDRGRIEISINRFMARKFCDSGKVDSGDGDTVFTQVMKVMERDDR